MVIFDANAILRYILEDNIEMANTVDNIINNNDCFIPTEVIAEIVYVLSGVYKIPRETIKKAVAGLLDLGHITTSNHVVTMIGLQMYATTKLDFVDCLLIGYQKAGYKVFSFDKALNKHL
ncbi:MAG: PIN domain-containing protein [Erysipelotrichaceae bacterium]|jgi:predicted nucleic-acid-binding protein|nr:PIN domain-containing protein [Erysipelotrichaceae bacterium]